MIYIIRHGKTELNKANVLQGRSNYTLNEEGIKEAKEAARKLDGVHFDHVFSSPLRRAVRTAEIIAPAIAPTIDERIIEMDYGPYEGFDLGNPDPKLEHFFKDFVNNKAPDGMEQLSSVLERTKGFLEDIRGLEGNILISTHAIAMKGILENLTPDSKGAYWSKFIGNCAVYRANNGGGSIGEPEEMK